ncbi:UDP-N-acetylmuramate--L-alanine ligase [Allobaculum stercoricanis]|uniref:UDP-N-acetylmuramate--L-alanine ligase n=1 Tax=Allobaculum stercoricanis TaxID=174709 RepID=UPI00037F2385|nr:Mur ligase domain-containing protein [Allobaculum stercoricanis]
MAIFFTGIKGTGMSALAQILADQGQNVRGSDIEKYVFTEDGLRQRGIEILPFDPNNIQKGDILIAGLAFGEDHPEIKRAKDLGVEVYWYNEYLGKLLHDYNAICVAGCHGKSTTTGLLAHILEAYEPTAYLIGDGHGHMPNDAKNFVLESCEFKRHFLAYHPDYALITNIELDHVDYYKDLDDYISAFQSFANQIRKKAIIFGDDPYLKHLNYPVDVVTYGLEEGNDYRGVNLVENEQGTQMDVEKDGKIVAHLTLNNSGLPFAWDSLGAFALASELGMPYAEIADRLATFEGIARRFVIEEVKDSVLVDDYAHHPTAISQMIRAAHKRYPNHKVIALYKPDRYSRLQFFLDRFAKSLNEANESFVLDFDANIKPEDETITVTIQDLVDRLENGQLITLDQQGAQILASRAPAVYLFMSSKNIYLLKDLLKDLL